MKFRNKITGTIIETNNEFVIEVYSNSETFEKIEVKKNKK